MFMEKVTKIIEIIDINDKLVLNDKLMMARLDY